MSAQQQLLLSPLTDKAVYDLEDHEARMVATYAARGSHKQPKADFYRKVFENHLAAFVVAHEAVGQRLHGGRS